MRDNCLAAAAWFDEETAHVSPKVSPEARQLQVPAGRQTPAVDDYGVDEFEDEEPVAVPAAVPAKVPAPAAVAVPAPMPAQPPAPSAASVSQPKAGRRLKHVHVGMLKCHEMPSCCHHAAIIAISC